MPLLDAIADRLDANIVALTKATNLFGGYLPDSPAQVVALFQTPSPGPIATMGGTVVERPRLQALVRDPLYDVAEALANDVFRDLDGLSDATLSGVRYLLIEAITSPAFLERDSTQPQGRFIFVVNFQVLKEVE